MHDFNLNITFKHYYEDGMCTDIAITLFSKPNTYLENSNNYVWAGSYKGKEVIVTIPPQEPASTAKITGLGNNQIKNLILGELERVLKILD